MLLRSPIQPITQPLLARRKLPTIQQQALAILRRFGTNAHAYIPGIGAISGLTAGNYSDAGITPAVVDGVIQQMNDPLGSINATSSGAARPTLRRGLVNLASWGGTPSNGAWVKNAGVSASGNVISGATGTVWGGGNIVTQSITGLASSTAYTAAFSLKSAGATTVTIYLRDQSTGGVTNTTLALTDTAQIVVASRTTGAATTALAPMLGASDGDVYFESAALFQGTLTAAQILAQGGIPLTTTAAASNPLAGRYSSQYGGAQSLTLGSVPFQMADDHAVIAGINATTSAVQKTVFSCAAAAGMRVAQLRVNDVTQTLQVAYEDATAVTLADGVVSSANTPLVGSCRKVGSTLVLRKNGAQVSTGTAPAGATTMTEANIGIRVAATEPYTGSLGWALLIKGTLTDAEMLTLERLVASQMPNGPSF